MRLFSFGANYEIMAEENDQDDPTTPGAAVTAERVRAVLELAARDVDDGPKPDRPDRDPKLLQAAARQRQVAQLLQSGGPAMPETLRVRLDALREDRARRRRLPLVGSVGRIPVGWTVGAVGVAAAAVAVVLVLGVVGGSGSLAATRVADVWKLPATGSAVTANPGDPAELNVSFHGTPLPNYHDSEGWAPAGSRSGTINGTPAFTVYYATGKRRAAYTVVAGTRVSVPAHAAHLRVGGLRLIEFRERDRWIIVFANHGNSCVLTAAAPREKTWLVKLAVWRSGAGTTPA
jgi:hypothetical protein